MFMAPAAFCLQTLERQPPGKLSAREPSMLVNFGDMQDRITFVARDQIPRIGIELVFPGPIRKLSTTRSRRRQTACSIRSISNINSTFPDSVAVPPETVTFMLFASKSAWRSNASLIFC